ncbi:MAG: aconitase X swivel domain-containing protein [Thermoproteota archaeon]
MVESSMVLKVKVINTGIAKGTLLISQQPISFFGGVDSSTGVIVEKNHPLEGVSLRGSILAVPSSKGSTVGSYAVYGLAKRGVAPLGIILGREDSIISAGAILAGIPVVLADMNRLVSLFENGETIILDARRGRILRS